MLSPERLSDALGFNLTEQAQQELEGIEDVFFRVYKEEYRNEQHDVVGALVDLIESTKKAFAPDYLIDSTKLEQGRLVEDVASKLALLITRHLTALNFLDEAQQSESVNVLRLRIVDRLGLDVPVTAHKWIRGWFERNIYIYGLLHPGDLRGWFVSLLYGKNRQAQLSPIRQLVEDVHGYVERNSCDLVDSLLELVQYAQPKDAGRKDVNARLDAFHNAFAIIAGQASQFEPLKKRLLGRLAENIDESGILILTGPEAKEACCRGAVSYYDRNLMMEDNHVVHGLYLLRHSDAFLEPEQRFFSLNGSSPLIEIDISTPGAYELLFTSRSKIDEADPPFAGDGYTSLLGVEQLEVGKTVVRSDMNGHLTWDGRPVSIHSRFGDITRENLPKLVWPEVLVT